MDRDQIVRNTPTLEIWLAGEARHRQDQSGVSYTAVLPKLACEAAARIEPLPSATFEISSRS